ncbi:hypothetical protein AB0D49_00250 [Streptomyces sp. NPDC048290]|uniref:hypothetical protein n=1 Tax=Streptomyces sp. NPDC048290 TaxID=3155811 RepID=UPI00341B2729
MTGSTRALLGVLTAVLVCALGGCGDDDAGSGDPGEPTPCATASASDEETGADAPGDGASATAPGASRAHTLDPSEGCVIESGIASMPEDP